MSEKTSSAFLITRPIQYLNAINIPRADASRTLLIVDSFNGARHLQETASLPNSKWTDVQIFESTQEAFNWVRRNKNAFTDFFTFSDFGLRLCLMLGRLKPLRIHIYEEGASSYIRDNFRPGSIRFFSSFFSSGEIKLFRHMGQCRFVDTIFVNHVELYRKLFPDCQKAVSGFSVPLLEHLIANYSDSAIVSKLPENMDQRDAILYLSDWTVNQSAFDVLAAHPSFLKVAKFHPAHSGSETFEGKFDLIVEPATLAEIIIAELAKSCRLLIIVHECSSAVLNCRLAGITFREINLGSSEKGMEAKFGLVNDAVEEIMAQSSRNLPTAQS